MPKIVFFIAEDWYFLSHRRPLAEACRDAGWEVVLVANVTTHAETIRAAGFGLEPLPIERGGKNPLRELKTLIRLVRILRRQRPDVLHLVGIKPVLYGNMAARLAGIGRTVSALAGLGWLFTSAPLPLRRLATAILRWLVARRGSSLIVQNQDDRALMLRSGIASAEQIVLIRGSGVDLAALPALPPPPSGGPVVFALIARMLADKGIREAVEASRELRRRGVAAELWLVGGTDVQNPSCLTDAELNAWTTEGSARWLGRQDDILGIWRQAHVAVLPSYREGMPKALLEAEACARPVITTDVEGCREAIDDGVEGLLVPVRQSLPLADAMQRLAEDEPLRLRMGAAARARAELLFDQAIVVKAHLDLYRRLIAR